MAKYLPDLVHNLETSRLLVERGLMHLKEQGLFLINLGSLRPALGDEPKESEDTVD